MHLPEQDTLQSFFAWRHATEVDFRLMFAAVPWHWWLGAGLLLAGIGAVVSLVAGYLRAVEAKKHPTRAQRRAQQQSN